MEVKREHRCRIRKRIQIVRKINRRILNPVLTDEVRESIWGIQVGIVFQKAVLGKIAYCLLKMNKPIFALSIALKQYKICLVKCPREEKLPSYEIALSAMQIYQNRICALSFTEIPLIVSWQYHFDKINLLLSIAEIWQTEYPDRSGDIVLFVMSAFQFDYPQFTKYIQDFNEINRRMAQLIPLVLSTEGIMPLWEKAVINFEKQQLYAV